MKNSDFSLDNVNKTIRNNLFAKVEKYSLIPLEDKQTINPDKGELFCYPNSNRVNDLFAPLDNGSTTFSI
jgi:hypothetical protein